MGNWSGHSTCNANPENEAKEASKAAAKSELMRYAHFFERFVAHQKAERFAATEQIHTMEVLAGELCARCGFSIPSRRADPGCYFPLTLFVAFSSLIAECAGHSFSENKRVLYIPISGL